MEHFEVLGKDFEIEEKDAVEYIKFSKGTKRRLSVFENIFNKNCYNADHSNIKKEESFSDLSKESELSSSSDEKENSDQEEGKLIRNL